MPKRILLVGNPNVGKSVVFTRLTGVRVIASNYPGTTVEFTEGILQLGGEGARIIDVPGVYSLSATSKAEEVALRMLEDGDIVINVVDATNLERNLSLTLQLLERKLPMVVALNVWDEAGHKGIHIDLDRLEELLGVPVVPTVAVTGEGIRELIVEHLPKARAGRRSSRSDAQRWEEVGNIVHQVQSLEHRHHTFAEKLQDLSVRPLPGILIAAAVLTLCFAFVRILGEGLIGWVTDPVFDHLYLPLLNRLSAALSPENFLHRLLIGELINGEIVFQQSFGLLTTALYVPIGMVFPYVLAFYLTLGFLEDSGYLPRLAVLLDSLVHRMGLHGWAIIPTLLGLGCNVPGILATRMLESRRERMICATLISIGVPCAATQAMIWGLVGRRGIGYVAAIYLTLFVVWLILGRVLNVVLHGRSPELLLEIPPYRLPSIRALARKLWMRMRLFFREAIPVVLLGILVMDLLHMLGLFKFWARLTAPLLGPVLGLPEEASIPLVLGFLRKDVAVGMLGTLSLTSEQLVVATALLAMFFPCIATFVVMLKELGPKDTAKSIAIMLLVSILGAGILHLILG
jgi:ferrous iron transport protein B